MLTDFEKVIQKWELKNVHLLSPDYPYVFKAQQMREQREVVVKLGVDPDLFKNEVDALQHYHGRSCVQIFDVDFEQSALLLELVHPGESLKQLFPFHDEKAVQACAKILEALHKVPAETGEKFSTLQDWFQFLKHKSCAILPKMQLDKARALAQELLDSSSTSVLLHGDLHHENILTSSVHGYVAIDPKGVLGDPAFDVAAFMRNPIPEILACEQPEKIIARRFELFSELLGFDLERLRAWTYVGAILACAWNIEDSLPHEELLDIAYLLEV